jgi:ATP-dependent helicase/nuclease subunit B
MPVRFVLGRAGTGKTRHCCDALLAELARGDERRLLLLVPEQAAFQMERALAQRAPGGGYTRAEVLSFSRLARRVFDQTGGEPETLSPEARSLALRAVVAQRGAALGALRRAAATTGFFSEFGRLIEELVSEGITPEDLRAAADRLDDPAARRETRETAEIYTAYLTWLGPQRIDPAARLAVLRQRLTQLPWLRDAALWIDGFAGFTGQEFATLVSLAGVVRDVTITLLLDPAGAAVQSPRQQPDPLGLFCRTETTYLRLRQIFAAASVEIQPPLLLQPATAPRFGSAPTLATLEAGLAAPLSASAESAGGRGEEVRVLECATHRDEVRAAARWIRKQLADVPAALHFRDFALIARDLAPFADVIAEVFEEYEIPYFLDCRRPLRAHPLSGLVAALLDAVLTDFEVRPMVRLLRTRLLPVSRDDAEQLENLITNNVVRGVEWWHRATWEFGASPAPDEAYHAVRHALVAALEPPLALAREKQGASGAAWAAALYDVLERLHVRRQLESWIAEARTQRHWENAELHRLAWEALCDVLDDLHAVLGDVRVTAAEVAGILTSALGELTLGLAPPTVDQVLVSAIERSRHPDIKHAWVLGVNEGIFPARPAEDLLLSTPRRQVLVDAGLAALPVHREDVLAERLLAYIAFTRPSQSLTISYAVVGDDGDKLLPSSLLTGVQRVLPGLAIARDEAHPPPTHVAELARGYLSVHSDARHVRERLRYARLCEKVRELPALAGPLEWSLRGLRYVNEPGALGNFRQPHGGPAAVAWDTSPSEIETYLQCPFRHFVRFGLNLQEWRGPKPLRWDLGDAAHELLANVTRRAMREPGGVHAVSDIRWQELLAAVVREYWQRRPADERARRADLAFQIDFLVTLLRDVVVAHAARWRRGQFEPLGCELEFRSPVGLAVRLRSKIDRADICRQVKPPLVLVYDYKSSGIGPLTQPFLTGSRLQLFLYLAALAQAEPTSRPAGVFLAPLYPDLGVLENGYAADADPAEQLMYLHRPRGMVTESGARLLDRQLGGTPSPVAQLRVKTNGDFYTNCDAKPAAAIEQRLDLAARTVLFAADGIQAGRIEIAPLVEKRARACSRCEFQAVCRFDPAYNPSRAAEAVLPHLEEETDEAEGDA